MKLNKVYCKNDTLIVCFKGVHYVSPKDTKVKVTQRVTVIVGEDPDTVLVSGAEIWTSMGSYLGAKADKVKKTKKVAVPREKTPKPEKNSPTMTSGDTESVLQRIHAVAPNQLAEGIMKACWNNWTNGCANLQLFQGLTYTDANDTKAVRDLGVQLMSEFGNKENA
ncbi:MAG: hypothetical protein NUW00_04875 [Candidatus Kaiserbacteria bacterium]|nr:hypothetical protein [Candidatus Kaiserbacteria bacterium]MCR4330910.1 hypothetical protein [Patescibacteria group bacterium]